MYDKTRRSAAALLAAYGFVGFKGEVSLKEPDSMLPYTSSVET